MAKYNNVKIDGYDSKKEYRRAKELKLLEKKGIITGLQEQVKYELISPQYHFYEVQGVRKMLHKKKLIERGSLISFIIGMVSISSKILKVFGQRSI